MKEFWCAEREIYPSIFRVLLGMLLLFDLAFSFSSFEFIFDSNVNAFFPDATFLKIIAEHYLIFIGIYAFSIFLWILGMGRNATSALVFVGYVLYFEMTGVLVTWGDVILKFSLFFFIFVNGFRYLSLGVTKDRTSLLSKLAVASIVLHLFLVYLSNAYFKISDTSWQDGVGVYYSFAQYPNFESSFWFPIVANQFFGPLLNYFIILLQLLFVPLVLWRKSRKWVIFVSILVHVAMVFQFGLWKFELIMLLLFGFVFNDAEWRTILPNKFHLKFFPKICDQ